VKSGDNLQIQLFELLTCQRLTDILLSHPPTPSNALTRSVEDNIKDIIRRGEEKTRELNLKYASLNFDKLQVFNQGQGQGQTTTWKGKEYSGRCKVATFTAATSFSSFSKSPFLLSLSVPSDPTDSLFHAAGQWGDQVGIELSIIVGQHLWFPSLFSRLLSLSLALPSPPLLSIGIRLGPLFPVLSPILHFPSLPRVSCLRLTVHSTKFSVLLVSRLEAVPLTEGSRLTDSADWTCLTPRSAMVVRVTPS
jgi:hypothetical protein